jgi:hypothetical protein
VERQLKNRFPIGSHVSEQRIVQDFLKQVTIVAVTRPLLWLNETLCCMISKLYELYNVTKDDHSTTIMFLHNSPEAKLSTWSMLYG